MRKIHELETEKRDVPISTPRFHALANRIEAVARSVFGLAASENRAGDRAPRQDRSINDVDAS